MIKGSSSDVIFELNLTSDPNLQNQRYGRIKIRLWRLQNLILYLHYPQTCIYILLKTQPRLITIPIQKARQAGEIFINISYILVKGALCNDTRQDMIKGPQSPFC